MNLPQPTNAAVLEPPVLCHVEDPTSPSFWNTPFRVKINLHGQVLDATLDTGASLSAVQADIIQNQAKIRLMLNHGLLLQSNWQTVGHANP